MSRYLEGVGSLLKKSWSCFCLWQHLGPLLNVLKYSRQRAVIGCYWKEMSKSWRTEICPKVFDNITKGKQHKKILELVSPRKKLWGPKPMVFSTLVLSLFLGVHLNIFTWEYALLCPHSRADGWGDLWFDSSPFFPPHGPKKSLLCIFLCRYFWKCKYRYVFVVLLF